ncbi:hypothetical protein PYW07_004995 [Mythimna separata]|uniref:Uncharacterized protein n=1 Tax=Mythimna separata TaxID=271217 RepID=A0AAD7YE13_MYTSE|nr:hypothetical protein PYW07_004995 [Mythimna separata]
MFDRTRVESETASGGYFINCSNARCELSRSIRAVPRPSRHLWTKMHTLILAALAAVSTAMPSYIAVPADQIAFVDLSQLHVRRVPRQTLSPPPQQLYQQEYQQIPIQQYQQQPVALAPAPENEPPARLLRLQQQPEQQDASGAASYGGASQFAERPPDFGEYVDFGAHTGDHGAFGWYADYPVNNHHDSSF